MKPTSRGIFMQQSATTVTGLFFGLILLIASLACKTGEIPVPGTNVETNGNSNENIESDTMSTQLKIKIGSKTFTATLLNNPTVTAFKSRLPMTISMSELNGNEKLYHFSECLPGNASNPRTISSGDLMIYGSSTLVLFYKSFSTSYSYTKLGRIDDANGLAAAAGPGNVTVTFELE
jgi:hypothetical protein